jgi:large subunit ribosomal protein L19
MTHAILHQSAFVASQKRTDIPEFKAGSLVEVHYKIVEGDKQRVQIFKGIVISRKGGSSMDAAFTVLRNSTAGIKVERTFPLHSPFIEKIVVTQLGRSLQSKPYYLREHRDPLKLKKIKKIKVITK